MGGTNGTAKSRKRNWFYPSSLHAQFHFLFLSSLTAPSSSTPGSSVNGTNATAVATGPCSGVIIDYAVGSVSMIPPLADPQPFRFEATATLQNIGSRTLKVGKTGHLFSTQIFRSLFIPAFSIFNTVHYRAIILQPLSPCSEIFQVPSGGKRESESRWQFESLGQHKGC